MTAWWLAVSQRPAGVVEASAALLAAKPSVSSKAIRDRRNNAVLQWECSAPDIPVVISLFRVTDASRRTKA